MKDFWPFRLSVAHRVALALALPVDLGAVMPDIAHYDIGWCLAALRGEQDCLAPLVGAVALHL